MLMLDMSQVKIQQIPSKIYIITPFVNANKEVKLVEFKMLRYHKSHQQVL